MRGWKFFMMCLMVLALMAMPLLACGDDGTKYDLTMAKTGNGTITPAVGAHTYNDGDVVDITATADSGWIFDGWTGDVANSDSASTKVTMDKAKTVTANFIEGYTLTMVVDGNGTTDPVVGTHNYDVGTVVDITATADISNSFNEWTGDVHDEVDNDDGTATAKVTMDGNKTITAVFSLEAYPEATITSPSAGEVVSGDVTVEATLTDNKSVLIGGFAVDNPQDPENPPIPVEVSSHGTSVDFSYTWDSTTVDNGEHTLYVLVRDNLMQGAFDTVTVTVNNPS